MTDNFNEGAKQRLLSNNPYSDGVDPSNLQNLNIDLNNPNQNEEEKHNYEDFAYDPSPMNEKSDTFQNSAGTLYENYYLQQQIFIPSSTRKALIAKWDPVKNKHILIDQDRAELDKRGLLYVWDMTANQIADDRRKQPMNYNPSIGYRLWLNLIRLFALLVWLYVEILLWSIFLMNVVQHNIIYNL